MKPYQRFLLLLFAPPLLAYALLDFYFRDPEPDVIATDRAVELPGNLEHFGKPGMLKTEATGVIPEDSVFQGFRLPVEGNDHFDELTAGISGSNFLVLTAWKNGKVVQTRHAEFLEPVMPGDEYVFSLELRDPSNAKVPGQGRMSLRLFRHTGFFGDAAASFLDISEWGAFHTTALELEGNFSAWRVWNGWNSRD